MNGVTWAQFLLTLLVIFSIYYLWYFLIFRKKFSSPDVIGAAADKAINRKVVAAGIVGETEGLGQMDSNAITEEPIEDPEQGEDESENQYPGDIIDEEGACFVAENMVEVDQVVDDNEYTEGTDLAKVVGVMDQSNWDDLSDEEKFHLVKDVAQLCEDCSFYRVIKGAPEANQRVLGAVEELQGTEFEAQLPDVSFLKGFSSNGHSTATENYFQNLNC